MENSKLFTVAKNIKRQILLKLENNQFETYEDLISYIESTIWNAGLEPAFPTTISPDFKVSNWTPIKQMRSLPLHYKICTIDFGILDEDGLISDTAVSSSVSPYWKEKINLYRTHLRAIGAKVNNEYLKNGFIYGAEITKIVETEFLDSCFNIIPECAAHKIKKNLLHAETILMCGEGVPDVKLVKGDYFTIEPHVTIGPAKVELEPGTIFLDLKTNKYDTLDYRLNLGSDCKNTILYSSVKSNSRSFYEEDTYYLGEGLVNCTGV